MNFGTRKTYYSVESEPSDATQCYFTTASKSYFTTASKSYFTTASKTQRGFARRETWMADLLRDSAKSIPDSPERLALLAMAEIEMMRIRDLRNEKT